MTVSSGMSPEVYIVYGCDKLNYGQNSWIDGERCLLQTAQIGFQENHALVSLIDVISGGAPIRIGNTSVPIPRFT